MKPVLEHLGRSLHKTLHGSRDVLNKRTKRDGITIAGLVLDLDLALVFHIAFPLIRRLAQPPVSPKDDGQTSIRIWVVTLPPRSTTWL